MKSSFRARTLTLLFVASLLLALTDTGAPPPRESPPPCEVPVLVEGLVARAGVVCEARDVSAAIAEAGGSSQCVVTPGDHRAVRAGDLVRVGEGAAESCSVRVATMPGALRLALGLKVGLNDASADDLRALPGMGAGLAARVVAHRSRWGPFRTVADLRAVRGVGPKRLRAWAELLSARPEGK